MEKNPLFTDTMYKGYDYTQPGFYGITLCTYHRRWFFGTIAHGHVLLNEVGHTAQQVWHDLDQHWPCVKLHEYVFMPNHMHCILELLDIPNEKQVSVFEVLRVYKAFASHTLRKKVGDSWLGWQRGSWKAVILNETHLARARQYIQENPIRWEHDRLMREDFKQHQLRRSRHFPNDQA